MIETQPNETVLALDKALTGSPDEPPAEVSPPPAEKPEQPVTESPPAVEAKDEEPQGPESIKDYATRVGVKPKDLYALTLPSGGTISELSDKAKDLDKLDTSVVEQARKEAEFRLQRNSFETAVTDWAQLVQGGQATPQALAKVQADRAQLAERNRLQTVNLIPEWSDGTVKAADQQKIRGFISRFGFGEADYDADQSDPRTHVMMRYIMVLEERFKAALEKVDKVTNSTTGRQKAKAAEVSSTVDGLSKTNQALLRGLQNGYQSKRQ